MLKIKEVLIISPGNLLFLEGLQGFPCRFDSVFSCVKVMMLRLERHLTETAITLKRYFQNKHITKQDLRPKHFRWLLPFN